MIPIHTPSILMQSKTFTGVANARSIQDYLITHDKLPRHKVRFIPNGIDLDSLRAEESSNRKSLLRETWRDKIILGTAGRLHPQKVPQTYLRVAKRVLDCCPDVRFLHLGNGPLRGEVEGLSQQLGIQQSKHFFGLRHDVPKLLRAMDIFVLTSHNEGMPNAIMEAMATGLRCVVTNTGDCRELVHDGETGFVVPIGDTKQLADRILVLVRDRRLRGKMGAKGRKYIEAFNVHRMTQQYQELYQESLTLTRNGKRHEKLRE